MQINMMAGKQVGIIGLDTLLALKNKINSVVAYDDEVSQYCNRNNIQTFNTIKNKEFLKQLEDSDLLVCVHGKEIVPKSTLSLPKKGCINVHPCLCKYKGSNPIGRLLRDGNKKASVGVHYMTSKIDEGEVITEKFIDIGNTDTIEGVYEKLYPLYASAIKSAIYKLRD